MDADLDDARAPHAEDRMKTVRRLLYREILLSTVFVMMAFLGLFFFIDFINDIDGLGQPGVTAWSVLSLCAMYLPGHVYELMPIAVLIGSIYALTRLAQSSEFTILRTGGLGPGRALKLLFLLGMGFVVATFVVGDFLTPWAETRASLLRAGTAGALSIDKGGAWLRDGNGSHLYTVNVAVARSDGEVEGVRIFEFGADQRLVTRTAAARAHIDDDGVWTLEDVHRTHWQTEADGQLPADEQLAHWTWNSGLDRKVVAAAVMPLQTMSTLALARYMMHLSEHEQAAQRYAIQFWKKAFYPFACLVMLALALPFAYLHGRSGGASYRVFGGIMLGISFVLLNSIFGHLGILHNWVPILAAGLPSLIYLLLSLGAFAWLVRYR